MTSKTLALLDTIRKSRINQQDKLAAGYVKEEPWLLLHRTGRTDRFATLKEALEEAKKSWAKCSFRKT